MLSELERETAARTNFYSGSTVYSRCMILITQHAPFSRKGLLPALIVINIVTSPWAIRCHVQKGLVPRHSASEGQPRKTEKEPRSPHDDSADNQMILD